MDSRLEIIYSNLWNRINKNYDQIIQKKAILSFSGGKDSRILLEFYNYLHRNHNIPIPIVFHLAHNIRNSEQEIIEIRNFLDTHYDSNNILISKIIPKLSKRIKKSLEETGRIVRRKTLFKLAHKYNAYITTGHHTKDYFETILINLVRDGGVQFNTMRTWDGNIFRPLTLLTDKQLNECYYLITQFKIWEDETNQSDLFFRNRIRMQILPLLEKEGLKFDRVYNNLHDDSEAIHSNTFQSKYAKINDQTSKKTKPFLTIPRDTCLSISSTSQWKNLFDIHLKMLSLSPARRSTILETYEFLINEKSFEYKTNEYLLSKQSSGPLFLIPHYSSCFDAAKIEYSEKSIEIHWNQNSWKMNLDQKDGYHIGYIENGLCINHNNLKKEISEIFRTNCIPKSIRKLVPIVFKENKPYIILIKLWNNELENFPKDWKE